MPTIGKFREVLIFLVVFGVLENLDISLWSRYTYRSALQRDDLQLKVKYPTWVNAVFSSSIKPNSS